MKNIQLFNLNFFKILSFYTSIFPLLFLIFCQSLFTKLMLKISWWKVFWLFKNIKILLIFVFSKISFLKTPKDVFQAHIVHQKYAPQTSPQYHSEHLPVNKENHRNFTDSSQSQEAHSEDLLCSLLRPGLKGTESDWPEQADNILCTALDSVHSHSSSSALSAPRSITPP